MEESALPGRHLRRLKSLAQSLEPVVRVGKSGLTEGLIASLDRALTEHELVKVKFEALKDQKKSLALELAGKTGSHVIQRVGHVVVLYRQNPESDRRKVAL